MKLFVAIFFCNSLICSIEYAIGKSLSYGESNSGKIKTIDGAIKEIDSFLDAALRGEVRIRDEKIKMYTNTNVSSSETIKALGKAVSELASRNIKIWHLEDEVRRTDLPDATIVETKRKIDTANQERNDLMDKVDEILLKHSTTTSRGGNE